MKIKCTEDVAASGKALEKGKEYETPTDISEQDAKALIQLKRAEIVEEETPSPEEPVDKKKKKK